MHVLLTGVVTRVTGPDWCEAAVAGHVETCHEISLSPLIACRHSRSPQPVTFHLPDES